MSYIYKITNNINGKIYIGKTNFSIEKRWKEHCRDYKKESEEKRPLYFAMKKYGIEHFYIEQVEECSFDEVSEREKYWIEYYGSFKNGYNATKGGDGKSYIDYDLVAKIYQELNSIEKTALFLNISRDTVRTALINKKIKAKTSEEVNKKQFGKIVAQYDLNDNLITVFSSLREAASSLNKKGVSHISDVAKGKRKTAYGYKWRYL